MLRYFIVAFLLALSLGARAETMPDQRPFLRIETEVHSAAIIAGDVSADGRLAATGSHDGTVRLWSVPDGKLVRIFRPPVGNGSSGQVFATALSPDGRLLAAGGWDAYYERNPQSPDGVVHIYVYDTVTGVLVRRLGKEKEVLTRLEFSPDGEWLAAGYGTGGIKLWNVAQGLNGPPLADSAMTAAVYGLSFDGKGRFAAAAIDGLIRIYDIGAELKKTREFMAAGGKVPFRLAYAPDGARLAVGFYDSSRVSIYGTDDYTLLAEALPADAAKGRGNLGTVAWSRDGSTLIAGGTYVDRDAKHVILSFADMGRAPGTASGTPTNTVFAIEPLPGGGYVWASGEPAVGMVNAAGEETKRLTRLAAEMRGKGLNTFWTTPDSSAFWTGLKYGLEDPWLFDVANLTLKPSPERPANVRAADVLSLNVEDWLDSTSTTVDKQVLDLATFEISHSLAIMPDKSSFFIGTDWFLYRYSARGVREWQIDPESAVLGLNISADGAIVVAAEQDGTVRWYRTADGASLLSLFIDVRANRWVAWTPSGYYAASPGGEDLIGWHINGKNWDGQSEFFSASRFRDRFYRPDIVQLVLKVKDEAKAIAEANASVRRKVEEEFARKDLPPVVEIISDPRGIATDQPVLNLQYLLRAPSGREVTKIEVRVDGELALEAAPRGFIEVDDAIAGAREIGVPVPPRDVTVTLVAFHGDQAGPAASVAVTWAGPKGAVKQPKLQALLVGISAYDDPQLKLRFAHKDAADLAAALRAQAGAFFAPDPMITVLQDHAADANGVVRALKALREAADEDTYTVVLLAGHGRTNSTNDFFFLPSTALLDDEPEVGTVSGDTIYKQIGQIKGKVVLFVDACHAANGIEGSGVDMTGFINRVTGEQNSIMMYASSAGREVSLESEEWQNGAFTEALLSVLETPSYYGADRLLFTPELEQALYDRVRALTQGQQTAVANKSGAVPPFPVAGL